MQVRGAMHGVRRCARLVLPRTCASSGPWRTSSFHGSCRGSRLLTMRMDLPFTVMCDSSTVLQPARAHVSGQLVHPYNAGRSACTLPPARQLVDKQGRGAHWTSALNVPSVESYFSRCDACLTPPVESSTDSELRCLVRAAEMQGRPQRDEKSCSRADAPESLITVTLRLLSSRPTTQRRKLRPAPHTGMKCASQLGAHRQKGEQRP